MSSHPTISTAENLLPVEGVGIRRIAVSRLFGQFDYDLRSRSLPAGRAARIILLYGENGSGKTTILRTLFYLLSHIDQKGHKSTVRRLRFKTFLVEFADGTEIIAEKKEDRDPVCEIRIERGGKILAQAVYPKNLEHPGPESRPAELKAYIDQQKVRDANHDNLLATLKALNVGMIYLTDARSVYSTVPDLKSADSEDDVEHVRVLRKLKGNKDEDNSALARAVEQISSWATRQALKGSNQGEEDVNSVYADIISRIASYPWKSAEKPANLASIVEMLREQERRSADFVRFGLAKPLKVKEIVASLEKLNSQTSQTVVQILEPYVTGLKKRLDALDPIRAQLAGFVDTLNSFYRNKEIHLDVNHGMTITSSISERLSANMLSSGEGQLLFLLASTIVARERSSLFMIDEPELSLNVAWQRQLVKSLLELTRDSSVQFVLATHSIELLTRYSEFVLDLESTNKH